MFRLHFYGSNCCMRFLLSVGNMSFKTQIIIVHKSNIDFGYNPKIASTQCLLVFSIPIEGALHEYGRCHFGIVEEIFLGALNMSFPNFA